MSLYQKKIAEILAGAGTVHEAKSSKLQYRILYFIFVCDWLKQLKPFVVQGKFYYCLIVYGQLQSALTERLIRSC